MNAEAKQKLLQESLKTLSEHFDYVQIYAGVREGGSSFSGMIGNGEWYARYGAVREWIIQQEEEMRLAVLNKRGEQG